MINKQNKLGYGFGFSDGTCDDEVFGYGSGDGSGYGFGDGTCDGFGDGSGDGFGRGNYNGSGWGSDDDFVHLKEMTNAK